MLQRECELVWNTSIVNCLERAIILSSFCCQIGQNVVWKKLANVKDHLSEEHSVKLEHFKPQQVWSIGYFLHCAKHPIRVVSNTM